MEIKYLDNKSLIIEGKEVKIGINSSKNDGLDISLGNKLDGVFSITTPGEYETKGAFIIAVQTNDKSVDEVNAYIINVEGVSILYLDKSLKEFTKKDIEKFGVVNLVAADLSENEEFKIKAIRDVDPQHIVPLNGTAEQLVTFIKELGSPVREEKKLKVTRETYSNEDYQTEIIKLGA